MTTGGMAAFGTLVKIGDGGGPESFTTIAELVDITGPGFKMNTADLTNHSSTGAWKELVGTILEGGQLKLVLNFIPTAPTHSQSTGLIRDFKNKTKRNFQLVFPDGGATTWTLPCLITALDFKAPVKDKLSADVTLEVAGAPTLAG